MIRLLISFLLLCSCSTGLIAQDYTTFISFILKNNNAIITSNNSNYKINVTENYPACGWIMPGHNWNFNAYEKNNEFTFENGIDGEFEANQKYSITLGIVNFSSKDSMKVTFEVNCIQPEFGWLSFDTISYTPGIFELTPVTDDDLKAKIQFESKIKRK